MAAFAHDPPDSFADYFRRNDPSRVAWPYAGAKKPVDCAHVDTLPWRISLGAALCRQLFLSGVPVHARTQCSAAVVSASLQLAKGIAEQMDFGGSIRRHFIHVRTFQPMVIAVVDGFACRGLLRRGAVDRRAVQACFLLQVCLSDWSV